MTREKVDISESTKISDESSENNTGGQLQKTEKAQDADTATDSPIGSEEISFKAGQTIYEEGDESDGAYLLISGEVDLFRSQNEAFHHLATIDDGNIFGETSVIRREVRSTTARAKTNIRCLFVDGPALRKAIANPLLSLIFRTMANRLGDRYLPKRELLKESQATVLSRKRRKVKKIRHTGMPELEGVTPLVVEKLASKVKIDQFPFHIGNTRTYGQLAQLSDQSLMMPLPTAPDLDSKHFEFIKRGEDIYVRDLGSDAGTVVNGKMIRKGTHDFEALLEAGETIIGTGGAKSKVTFVVTLRELGVQS